METLNDCIQLMWVPSHQGISGNESADRLAAEATTRGDIIEVPHSAEEVLAEVNRKARTSWQQEWQQQSWQLKTYLPVIGSYSNSHQQRRRWEVVMARLRLGVCVFTHQHLFNASPRAICEKCITTMTIKHLLIECPAYKIQRRALKEKIEGKTTFNLQSLLGEDAPVPDIMEFLVKIDFIKKI